MKYLSIFEDTHYQAAKARYKCMNHTATSKILRVSYKVSEETSRNIARIGTAWLPGDIEPSMPRVVGRQQHRSKLEAETLNDYYKRALTISLLYHLFPETNTFFDPNYDAVMSSPACTRLAGFARRKPCTSRFNLRYYANDLRSPQFLMWSFSVGGESAHFSQGRNGPIPVPISLLILEREPF